MISKLDNVIPAVFRMTNTKTDNSQTPDWKTKISSLILRAFKEKKTEEQSFKVEEKSEL